DPLTLTGHTAAVTGLAWAPAGQLVSASRDGTVRLWDPGKRQSTLLFTPAVAPLMAVAWNPGADTLALVTRDGAVQLWRVPPKAPSRAQRLRSFQTGGGVYSLAWSPDGKRLATAGPEAGV